MKKSLQVLAWIAVSLLGAFALATIALHRGEQINALWLVVAAVSTYAVGYRFYSSFIAAKVLALDPLRATPAERLDNGRDFVPTNKWVVFGHHFAAIAGPGPLVGPVLAAQFGYLPGTLWIIAGAVLGGCVQDFVILLFSIRRDGKSLTEMAKSEIGRVGGIVAYVAVLSIIVILLGATALIVVNALKSSPWGTFTIAMTMPIAVLMGVYLRRIRPGKVLETSLLGFALVDRRHLRRTVGFEYAIMGRNLHADRTHAGNPDHRVWIRRVLAAGMDVAGSSRLPEHVRETRNDFSAGGWHRSASSIAAHAATDALCGWHRPSLCGNDLSVCIYHHRVRRHQWIPLADLERHHAEVDPPRTGSTLGWLRWHDGRVDGRDHGDDCRVGVAARSLLRCQQSRWHCRTSAGNGRCHDQFVGISSHRRTDGNSGARRG